jgi:hypothetical protein
MRSWLLSGFWMRRAWALTAIAHWLASCGATFGLCLVMRQSLVTLASVSTVRELSM